MTAYVGIDLSLTSTGVAYIGDGRIEVQRIQSKGRKGASLKERDARLTDITNRVIDTILDAKVIAVEAPSFGQQRQGGVHDRAGLWWHVVRELLGYGCAVIEVPPACRAKYATGRGNAGKDEVLAAVCRRYPHVEVTGNDVADALILAAIAARLDGHPIEESLPLANLTALDKLGGAA